MNKYIQDYDKVRCMVCNKELKVVHTIHTRTHGLEFDEYKKKFPNSKTHADSVIESFKENGKNQFKKFGPIILLPGVIKKAKIGMKKSIINSGRNCEYCGKPIRKGNKHGCCGSCYKNHPDRIAYMKIQNSSKEHLKKHKKFICIDCGKKIWNYGKRCKSCARKQILKENPGTMSKLAHLSNMSQRGHRRIPPQDNNGRFCKFCENKGESPTPKE